MASFEEHINQCKLNLDFLSKINNSINDRWDWQVTVCFYASLHLINAHIVKKTSKNYLSHQQVEDVINPYSKGLSPGKLNENTYLAYNKLSQLSRRSRYLLSENFKKNTSGVDIQAASLTYSKHLRKAIAHLDVVIDFMAENYGETFSKFEIRCIDLNGLTFKNFTVVNV